MQSFISTRENSEAPSQSVHLMVIISAGDMLKGCLTHCFQNQEFPTVLHRDTRYQLADIHVVATKDYTQVTSDLERLLLFAHEEVSLGVCHSN